MVKKVLFFSFITMVLPFFVFGQEGAAAPAPAAQPPAAGEESNALSLLIIKSYVSQNTQLSKKQALVHARSVVESGKLTGADKTELALIVIGLAGETVSHRTIDYTRTPSDNELFRAEAAGLLGEIGDRRSFDGLVDILLSDISTTVASEAVLAISKLTGIDDKTMIAAIVRIVRYNRSVRLDSTFCQGALAALENIADVDTELLNDESIIYELTYMTFPESGYILDVRQRAMRLLDRLIQA